MTDLFEGYADAVSASGAWDEMFTADATVREATSAVHAMLTTTAVRDLRGRAEALASSYVDKGVTFAVGGEERPFPLDIVPRVVAAADWEAVETGVAQRVRALEAFLADVYGPGRALEDGVVPRRVITSSAHFHRGVAGIEPPNGVRVHVAGVDLVRDEAGRFVVLEDNVRVPSGVSYVLTNRGSMASAMPETFADQRIRPVSAYPRRLLAALRASAPVGVDDPTVVVLTPGVFNSAYFEHALLARSMGIELVEGRDLICRGGRLHMRTTAGLRPVHVVYRRVDDEFLDPVHFRSDSLLGCPGLLNAARAGNVTIANAIGNGVADDKLLYTYVPDLVRYYLSEEPILPNVATWRLEDDDAREEVFDRLAELVVKPVDGSGGKGIVIGPAATREELDALRSRVAADPRGWIAQPVVALSTVPTLVGDHMAPRHVDLRPFAVNDGSRVWVLPGGLTRVALGEGQLIVNSSAGGGSKDTWVLAAGHGEDIAAAPARDVDPLDLPSLPPDSGPGIATSGDQQQQQQQQQQRHEGRPSPAGGEERDVLSRIAEALFWIGRYVERAEDTSRLLDVQLQLLVEDPWLDEQVLCKNLLTVMGAPAEGPADRRRVLEVLGYDAASPTSIVSCLGGARENARRARETVSTEMWEVINTAWNSVPSGRWRSASPTAFFAWVRDRTATVTGIADSTMSRDDGWLFLVLGRSIERADMTARLVTSTAARGGPASLWPSLLRACGAHEAFLRTYRGLEADTEAAEFLLLDRLFPRSVVHALAQAERCLSDLESSGQRAGVFDEAQRRLGRARAELEYRPLADVLAHLPEEMERVQRTCTAASDAVTRRYFASSDALTLMGGTA